MTSARLSSCTRFRVGAGEPAVQMVTLLPPPCGMSATLSSCTPIVAQSSDAASLTSNCILTLCCGGVVLVPAEPPPPQPLKDAARLIISALQRARRNIMRSMWIPSVVYPVAITATVESLERSSDELVDAHTQARTRTRTRT